MAVALVQSVTGQDASGVNTVSSATFVSALTPGSKIVVFVETSANTTCTITDTAGNTYTQINAGIFNTQTGYKTIIAWADNTSSQAANKVTATWAATGAFRSAGISEWTGLATGAPDIFTTAKNLAGTTTPTDDSMTTTVNGDLIVSVCASDGSAVTAGAGYTLLGDTGIGPGWEYQVQSTAGAIAPTLTLAPSAQSSIQSVAFKPSGAPAAARTKAKVYNRAAILRASTR
jgi:hypothetical protein